MDRLLKFKESFPTGKGIVYLNNAGYAPICRPARDAIHELADKLYEINTKVLMGIFERYDVHAREMVAKLVGAEKEQVAFFQTCAAAISQAALGLPLKKDDEILSWDQEYASNGYPWIAASKRYGAKIRFLPSNGDYTVDTQKIIDAINPRTKVIAISWVQYQSGAITDLKALSGICRKNNIILAVDAFQGLGVMPFDMQEMGVDIVCGGSSKWNCGPLGLGYMVARKDLIPKMEPIYYGAMSYLLPNEKLDLSKELKTTIARFEPGAPLLFTAAATSAAIELLLATGIESIHTEAIRLSDLIIAGMKERGFEPLGPCTDKKRSPITTFKIENNKRLAEVLNSKGVVCVGERADGLRLAPHAFLRDSCIESFFEAFDQSLNVV